MKIALCQLNTIAGNIESNVRRITEELRNSRALGAQLAVFPELTITGYPPKDLLEYDDFVAEAEAALKNLHATCNELQIDAIIGNVQRNPFGGKKPLVNTATLLPANAERQVTYKKLLPTYDVFDEDRYFRASPSTLVPPIADYPGEAGPVRVGISICEDIWNDHEFWKAQRLYDSDPIESLTGAGADLLVNISASPFVSGKPPHRIAMLRHTARRWGKPTILVNQVGGCDQIIFDGGSCVVMPDGTIPCALGWFDEKTLVWDTASTTEQENVGTLLNVADDEVACLTRALQLGLRDYLAKTGFSQVVVGSSGGIDSAVVLAIAVATLGAENVISVSMPGPFTSPETRRDSRELASRLCVRHLELPIDEPFSTFVGLLEGKESDTVKMLFHGGQDTICKVADENLQSRLRGIVLMWISNAITEPRTLVLSTGNKSEMATGYCTLYGDMAGGLAVISDVPKMMVYKIARHLNQRMKNSIPESIIDREPTAELAPDQKDTDSLPPYPILDEIIRLFIEERQSISEIIKAGFAPEATVRRVIRLIELSEYKRAQAAPGLKVTSKAFGFGRRMPIARGT